jgi:hypothetical protein
VPPSHPTDDPRRCETGLTENANGDYRGGGDGDGAMTILQSSLRTWLIDQGTVLNAECRMLNEC